MYRTFLGSFLFFTLLCFAVGSSPLLETVRHWLTADPAFDHMIAAEDFSRARRWEPAIAECHAALKIDPDFVKARYLLARIYERQHKKGSTMEEYRRIIALSEPKTPPLAKAEAHLQLGNYLEQKGHHAEARREWEFALASTPVNVSQQRAIYQIHDEANAALKRSNTR